MDGLLARHDADLLRIKGIVNARGQQCPIVIHSVQHIRHPPASLPAWPADDQRTRIVFITRDLGRSDVGTPLD